MTLWPNNGSKRTQKRLKSLRARYFDDRFPNRRALASKEACRKESGQ
jgi:hypothetical protein